MAGKNTNDATELMDSLIVQARQRQHLQDEPVVTKSQDAFNSLETEEYSS